MPNLIWEERYFMSNIYHLDIPGIGFIKIEGPEWNFDNPTRWKVKRYFNGKALPIFEISGLGRNEVQNLIKNSCLGDKIHGIS